MAHRRGWRKLRRHRVERGDEVVGWARERIARQDISTTAGEESDDSETGRGRAATGNPDNPGPGGANCRETDTGTDLGRDLEPNAYGYRPKKSAQDAIQEVDKLLYAGYTDIVDADLSKYLDTASYCPLIHESSSNKSGI
jgi:hypothetical protein